MYDSKINIGIDIGGTKINIGIVDENGNILAKAKIPTDAILGCRKIIKCLSDIQCGIF